MFFSFQPSIVAAIPSNDLMTVLYSHKSRRNPERLAEFLKHVETNRLLEMSSAVQVKKTLDPLCLNILYVV